MWAQAGWMTQLNPSPLLVGMVLTAGTLPVFSGHAPAGAIADMVDRRRLYFSRNGDGHRFGIARHPRPEPPHFTLRPAAFHVFAGIGTVLNDPAWQAITPEVVFPRQPLGSRRPEFCRI